MATLVWQAEVAAFGMRIYHLAVMNDGAIVCPGKFELYKSHPKHEEVAHYLCTDGPPPQYIAWDLINDVTTTRILDEKASTICQKCLGMARRE